MQNNTPTFIEKLRHQIKEEQRRYHEALMGNKEFLELRQIKSNIKKLQARFDGFINYIHGYIQQNSQD